MLFAGLVLAGLAFILYLGQLVKEDLDGLSTASHDDIRWNMSQLEIELLKLNLAAHDVAEGHAADLSAFRTRFDIFYSRVSTLNQAQQYRIIRDVADARAGLAAANAFLDMTVPLVDGLDGPLHQALPQIQTEIETLQPTLRAFTLAVLQVFADVDAARRAELSNTLVKLAASVLGLILILVLAVLVLIRLHRQRQRVSRDKDAARSLLEAAVSSTLDAVLIADTSGRIVEFNGAAEGVFGYTRAEVIGADMADKIVPPHLRDAHRKGMARFLETGQRKVIDAGRVRLEGMRKSGKVFPAELSISLAETDGEQVFVSFLRDITRELEAEQELRSARDKAQESDRAKSDLLTVMSHEMRTPLHGILGSLSLIDRDNLDDRQVRHLNSISTSGEILLSHVNDVLDMSSLDSEGMPDKKTVFDLRDMVQQTVDSMSAAAKAQGNTLSLEFMMDATTAVIGSERSLQRCLINLLGNAIKFTQNGVVSVEVERLANGDQVEIRVADTGVGIAPENLDRVFDAFVTVDTRYARRTEGTGLGLAITKRLVKAMEGEIKADSIPGEGSLFTLRIPLTAVQASVDKATVGPGPVGRMLSGHCALVVDDNEINRMILVDMLQDLGFDVEEAADGYAAVAAVAARRFDVVFLDISMPGIDGIETLQRIRGLDVEGCDVPAIAVTAHAAPKDHQTIRQAPFADLMVKPVLPDDIRVKLASVLDGPALNLEDTTETTGINAFRQQFGDQKYAAALQDFHAELGDLIDRLDQEGIDLTPELRAKAHKIAGAAAVLAEDVALRCLRDIEGCEDDGWPEIRQEVLGTLRQTIQVAHS